MAHTWRGNIIHVQGFGGNSSKKSCTTFCCRYSNSVARLHNELNPLLDPKTEQTMKPHLIWTHQEYQLAILNIRPTHGWGAWSGHPLWHLGQGDVLFSTLVCCLHWFKKYQPRASKPPSPKVCSNFAAEPLPLAFVMAWVLCQDSTPPTIKSTKLLSPWHQF